MKKLIFTFAIVLLTAFAFPQSYHKLIRTNTTWDEYYVNLPEFCYTGASRVFFTDQDTVINGFTYRISKQQPILTVNGGPFCPPFVIDTVAYPTGQFLREDTIAKKVYIYNPQSTGVKDQLFYDFSLLPGDTLKSEFYFEMGDTLVVESVWDDSLNNGEYRKVFIFNSNLSNAYYLESIGNSYGLFYPIPIGFAEAYGGYFCVKENSVNLWGDECNYYYVGQNEIKDEPVSVYPNPADNVINIVIPQDYTRSDFILTNLNGEQVLSDNLESGLNRIPVSGLVPGIYFYLIKSKHGTNYGKLTII